MRFTRDFNENLTVPDFILTKANGERIGVIPCTAKSYVKKFKAPDEITFTSYLMNDEKENIYYERLQSMQYIEVPDFGRFVIMNVEEHGEGSKFAYKNITCKDISVLLGQRYLESFVINMGTVESIDSVCFYKLNDPSHSLLHMTIGELFPAWTYGHIDVGLTTMQRSFEVTKQDVYAFLMNDVSEAFECTFFFDTLNYIVNVYKNENVGQDTNVLVSYNNLVKNTNITCNTDDIKTCMVLTGDDDLTVREVARGSDRIYNLDWFNSTEYWSQSLYDAYNAWETLTYHTPVNWDTLANLTYEDINGTTQHYFVFDTLRDMNNNYVMHRPEIANAYQAFLNSFTPKLEDNYNNLYTFLLAKYQGYYYDLAEWTSKKIPAGNNARYVGYGDFPIGYPNNIDMDSTETFHLDRYNTVELVNSLPSTGAANVLYLVDNTTGAWRWYDNRWVNTNIWSNLALNPLNEKLKSFENSQAVAMKNGYGTTEVISADPTQSEINAQKTKYITYYLPYVYAIDSIKPYITTAENNINLINQCLERLSHALAGVAYYTDMKTNLSTDQLKELSKFIRESDLSSNNYVVTDVMTESERFEMLDQFLLYGEHELAKVAQPQFKFTIDMVNIFAIPEFDKYSGDFDIGNYVRVMFRDDYQVRAMITEIHFNFYNPDDFSIVFSNTLRKTNNGILSDIADARREAHTAATSVSFNASYWTQGAKKADSTTKALEEGLTSAGYVLTDGTGTEAVWDERGLFLNTSDTSSNPNDSIYLGGGRILFTDDDWKTVSTAIGRVDIRGESTFGVIAKAILAGYIEGTDIVGGTIKSTNYNYTSGSYANSGTYINLSNGEIRSKNFSIDSDGTAYYRGSGSGITDKTISGSKLIDGTINSVKIADYQITETKIAGNSISTSKIQANAIGVNQIASNAVTSDKIEANAITSDKIKANSITTSKLATDAIKSNNYTYSSGNYSDAGTFLNLQDGMFRSKNFYISNTGSAYFKGDISGSNITGTTITVGGSQNGSITLKDSNNNDRGAWNTSGLSIKNSNGTQVFYAGSSGASINGSITATSGKIGGFTLSGDFLVGGRVTLGPSYISTNEITIGDRYIYRGSYASEPGVEWQYDEDSDTWYTTGEDRTPRLDFGSDELHINAQKIHLSTDNLWITKRRNGKDVDVDYFQGMSGYAITAINIGSKRVTKNRVVNGIVTNYSITTDVN